MEYDANKGFRHGDIYAANRDDVIGGAGQDYFVVGDKIALWVWLDAANDTEHGETVVEIGWTGFIGAAWGFWDTSTVKSDEEVSSVAYRSPSVTGGRCKGSRKLERSYIRTRVVVNPSPCKRAFISQSPLSIPQ